MDSKLLQIAGHIVNKDLSSCNDLQAISELKSFIIAQGGGDLLIDNDISTLFELACIYGDIDLDSTMISVNAALLDVSTPVYKRVGPIFRPKENPAQKKILTKFAETICGIHLDLHYQFKDQGVAFLDATNVVFSFESVRQIEDIPYECSGSLILNRIKNKLQLNSVINTHYQKNKKWVFLGKHNRCQGKYLTTTEVMDLTSNRKIITFDRYE